MGIVLRVQMPLSSRLQKIFDLAQGNELWDIGCDHGLLAAHNSMVKKFSKVICIDRSMQVIQKLPSRFKHEYLLTEEQLNCIAWECVDAVDLDWQRVSGTVVLAGFGCKNICEILSQVATADWQRLNWIIAPQDGPAMVIDYLLKERGTMGNVHRLIERFRRRTIVNINPTYVFSNQMISSR